MQAFSFDTYDLYITATKAGDIGSKIDDVGFKVDELQQKIDELSSQITKMSVKKPRKPTVKKVRTPEEEAILHAKRVEAGKKGAAAKARNAALKKEKELEDLKTSIRAQVELEFAMKKQEREVLENL
jgi:hypothetical protein